MSFGRLIIVDDDSMTCELLETASEGIFSEIKLFNDAQSFLQELLCSTDIILLDLQMPEIDGVETIRLLSRINCPASLILMSGYDESVLRSARVLARDLGLKVEGNLAKPIGISQLTGLLNRVVAELKSNSDLNHHHSMVTDPAKYMANESDLAKAIDEHQLVLHYQPQVSLKSNALVGLEALVRWQHPQYGMLFPDRFIGLAERSGLIGRLTEEVINQAVSQSAMWHEQGYAFKVSVNISSENVSNLSMPEYLESLTKKHKLDPRMLMLEITESALMSEITTSLDILTRLRLKGFKLSIDDFGTGFSSLSQLHKIPFTELKIDQSFVMKMVEDPQSAAIVETCIMLGHKLKMSVVAEGVEDHRIWTQLKALNCDIAQGYQIAKPLPPDELIKWYKGITRMRGINVMNRMDSKTANAS